MRADGTKVTELRIQRDAILALSNAQRTRVECQEGSLWITIDNDMRDIVLGPGQSFEHAGPRRMLVTTLADSSVRVSSCARPAAAAANGAAPWRRFWTIRHAPQPRIALI